MMIRNVNGKKFTIVGPGLSSNRLVVLVILGENKESGPSGKPWHDCKIPNTRGTGKFLFRGLGRSTTGPCYTGSFFSVVARRFFERHVRSLHRAGRSTTCWSFTLRSWPSIQSPSRQRVLQSYDLTEILVTLEVTPLEARWSRWDPLRLVLSLAEAEKASTASRTKEPHLLSPLQDPP